MNVLRRFIAILYATWLEFVNGPAVDTIARQAKLVRQQRQLLARQAEQVRRYKHRTHAEICQSRIFRLQIWRSLNGKN